MYKITHETNKFHTKLKINKINMSPTAIAKLKTKYKLTDKDLTSIFAYIVSDNKIYSWSIGAGIDSTAKKGSISVIASRWFQNQNVIDCCQELEGSTTNLVDDEKEKNQEVNNNKSNPIELSPNMSNAELVEFFKHELDNVTDKTKRFDLQMKMLDKLDIKANNAVEDGNKPLIYLPQRCDNCEYYKAK